METIRIGLAQINTTVGDLEGNTSLVLDYAARARKLGVDLLAFPELAVTGYPPEDLLLKPHFVRNNLRMLDEIVAASGQLIVVVGFVDTDGSDIYNAAAVIAGGKLAGVYRKTFLPNYGVFDEERYFQSGEQGLVLDLGGARVGVNICEDIWYPGGPAWAEALIGDAHLLVNISSSPYYAGKTNQRERMLRTRAVDNTVALAYCNLVGGQDELVFDGNSLIIGEDGRLLARGSAFEEDLVIADVNVERIFSNRLHDPRRRREKRVALNGCSVTVAEIEDRSVEKASKPDLPRAESLRLEGVAEIYRALVVGTRDYVRKNRFDKVFIGLSGGIDSALTAVIAADAVEPASVNCVFMPSRYSSEESARDAASIAKNLRAHYRIIPIDPVFGQYLAMLAETFQGLPPDTTEENLQARIRGNILMALSNKFRGLVLSTGNKSEMSVGYATIYGDMAGGFAVLKDVPKTLVYELAEYVNSRGADGVIPDYVVRRAPSAELKPNQTDQDTLPPYPVLDAILEAYIEDDLGGKAIAEMGFDIETVNWVMKRVDAAEYKRRQSAPGIKITTRAFGRDRRMPITNRFRD
jgi:NAD+ synthase (glutamine-hydrolysing)